MPELPFLDLIRRQLARARGRHDPRARILANVDGPVSPVLLEMLDQPGREASVLLALIERPVGLTVLFTERAAHLKDHAGQISLPGGRLAHAGETPVAAALREAAEEVGLASGDVAVLGSLDVHLTGTGFAVTPVVGFVAGPFEPQPDPAEVASVFEVPLDFILDPLNTRATYRERFGTRFRTHELSYAGHRIWGATAAMLVTFRDTITYEKTTE
ncbi:MAG TPA: CoA pyrophosphatase [Gammaproteobacteria bacterium]|nr:CoA pyrophosphatase [Gammaproteobacteria bacterium]